MLIQFKYCKVQAILEYSPLCGYVSLSGSQPVMDGEVCTAPVEDVEDGLLQSCCWGGGGGVNTPG